MEDIETLEIELAKIIMANQEKEADAVKGYIEQINAIDNLINALSNGEKDTQTLAFLEVLKSETEEKISDELNHQQGLLSEFVEFTGIKINKD